MDASGNLYLLWNAGSTAGGPERIYFAKSTDAGLTGWGEVCPLGPFYLPAYAAGVRAGIAPRDDPSLLSCMT